MSIITLRDPGVQTWQWHLKHAIRTMDKLNEALGLELEAVDSAFPLLVPQPYLSRMTPGDARDPLLLQVLPVNVENNSVTGFDTDPLAEHGIDGTNTGLLQKYSGRVLIMATGACAVNCRYCFRRHFPYSEHQPDWQAIEASISRDRGLREIILSGGDPLLVSDQHLGDLITSFNPIKHVRTLRIHTRLPVVIPQRVCDSLLDAFSQSEKQIVMVLHVNHPREIDPAVEEALHRLKRAEVTLLNQSVLLKDINNNAETLCELSNSLFEAGVLPYYLHLLDPVAGAAHFEVPEEDARTLMDQLTESLPGYLVPRLVREVPGASAKTVRYP
jgi:EF-P beta-lysylation protein EpmB